MRWAAYCAAARDIGRSLTRLLAWARNVGRLRVLRQELRSVNGWCDWMASARLKARKSTGLTKYQPERSRCGLSDARMTGRGFVSVISKRSSQRIPAWKRFLQPRTFPGKIAMV